MRSNRDDSAGNGARQRRWCYGPLILSALVSLRDRIWSASVCPYKEHRELRRANVILKNAPV